MNIFEFDKIKKLKFESKILAEKIKELETAIEYSAVKYSDMPKSHDAHDKKNEQIIKLLMLKDKYIKLVSIAETKINKAIEKIRELPEPQYKVIYYRYLKNMTWSEIAKETNYHIRTCYKLESKAIKKLKSKK